MGVCQGTFGPPDRVPTFRFQESLALFFEHDKTNFIGKRKPSSAVRSPDLVAEATLTVSMVEAAVIDVSLVILADVVACGHSDYTCILWLVCRLLPWEELTLTILQRESILRVDQGDNHGIAKCGLHSTVSDFLRNSRCD